MSILVSEKTRLLVQGITGREGSFHTQRMLEYGTNIVAGVTPGKGGSLVGKIPVFDSVAEAVEETEANASIVFVPARFAGDAIYEAVDSGLELIVVITEGIPVQDMLRIARYLEDKNTRLLGPNSPGLIAREAKVGIIPSQIYMPGNIGVVSRSGTLTYEVVAMLSKNNLGQSTCLGIGGDQIAGTSFLEVLKLFEEDHETKAVVLVGEIGGSAEEEALDYIKHMSKPVLGYIVGTTAPPDKTMGHAGAIISMGSGTALEKIQAFKDAGIPVAMSINDIVWFMKNI